MMATASRPPKFSMDTSTMLRIVHGSQDSTDLDVNYFTTTPIPPDRHSLLVFCNESKDENRNVLCYSPEHGVVIECMKGTPDETNNSSFATYGLHEQTVPNPIQRNVRRAVLLKLARSVRSILSRVTRVAPIRTAMKDALHTGSLLALLQALQTIDWTPNTHPTAEKKSYDSPWDAIAWSRDHIKSVAFQLCQSYALLCGVELFTKASMRDMFPLMGPLLYREDIVPKDIADRISLMIKMLVAPFLSSSPLIRLTDRKYAIKGKNSATVSVAFATQDATNIQNFYNPVMSTMAHEDQSTGLITTAGECHGSVLSLRAGIERALYLRPLPDCLNQSECGHLVALYCPNLHFSDEPRQFDFIDLTIGEFDTPFCKTAQAALANTPIAHIDFEEYFYCLQVRDADVTLKSLRRRITGDLVESQHTLADVAARIPLKLSSGESTPR